jgi:hypothetical protein
MSPRLVLLALAVLGGVAGCKCCGKKPCDGPPYPHPGQSSLTVPPSQPILPGPPGTQSIQPVYPGSGTSPPVFPGPGSIPPSGSRYGPIVPAPATPWQPTDQNGVRLTPPIAGIKPAAVVDVAVAASPLERAAAEAAPPSPVLPVGIPDFTTAGPRLARGLKPDLDGLDWLRANGYQTVLHLHAPGEDDSADRRQVEKRGMRFVSVECPTPLARCTTDEFARLTAAANQPLFVYDRDGSLAGVLISQR